MHSKKESILKRWHSFRISPKACAKKWGHQYWQEKDGLKSVSCKNCPSFNLGKNQCAIGFGTPTRKCVISSIEAHFYDCKDESILEIGYGRFKLAKNLIQRSGGTWTGIEPKQSETNKVEIGKGGYGLATDIRFPDDTFDRVFGVQSIEHWGQKAGNPREPSSYQDCISEIGRVLKPGGIFYQDTAAHYHGNEIFIMADLKKIRELFPEDQWQNVQIEQWRKDYQPLERLEPQPRMVEDWPIEITSYPQEDVDEIIANRVVWMMVITAEKI
ncbi:MAG: hypothetical protein DRQ47_00480 [Gammaproteobacteria bacterium]|nr:MAG: hypothetical protein DRQ47_00480 [Gammaproteobacteria bacterium]